MIDTQATRIIKRYSNRRMYDSSTSQYVNLSYLRQLVLDGVDFKVLLEKTNEDLTKNVLMQIFLELEMSGHPIFSDQSLKNLIILNQTISKDFSNSYLCQMFKLFEL